MILNYDGGMNLLLQLHSNFLNYFRFLKIRIVEWGMFRSFCLRTIYSGSFFFMNVNTYKHSYSKCSSFVKRKMKFFGHLYTSKVETKTYTNGFTTWCVRVCICYVGCWQNTSYSQRCLYSVFERVGSRHPPLHFHSKLPA